MLPSNCNLQTTKQYLRSSQNYGKKFGSKIHNNELYFYDKIFLIQYEEPLTNLLHAHKYELLRIAICCFRILIFFIKLEYLIREFNLNKCNMWYVHVHSVQFSLLSYKNILKYYNCAITYSIVTWIEFVGSASSRSGWKQIFELDYKNKTKKKKKLLNWYHKFTNWIWVPVTIVILLKIRPWSHN